MQCNRGSTGFRRAPRTHDSVLPSPAELPISRISRTPAVAATPSMISANGSSLISGGIRRSSCDPAVARDRTCLRSRWSRLRRACGMPLRRTRRDYRRSKARRRRTTCERAIPRRASADRAERSLRTAHGGRWRRRTFLSRRVAGGTASAWASGGRGARLARCCACVRACISRRACQSAVRASRAPRRRAASPRRARRRTRTPLVANRSSMRARVRQRSSLRGGSARARCRTRSRARQDRRGARRPRHPQQPQARTPRTSQ